VDWLQLAHDMISLRALVKELYDSLKVWELLDHLSYLCLMELDK
jgi:hypothetical protein